MEVKMEMTHHCLDWLGYIFYTKESVIAFASGIHWAGSDDHITNLQAEIWKEKKFAFFTPPFLWDTIKLGSFKITIVSHLIWTEKLWLPTSEQARSLFNILACFEAINQNFYIWTKWETVVGNFLVMSWFTQREGTKRIWAQVKGSFIS